MSQLPYEFGPVEFDAPGGQVSVVELRVPHRGSIATIRLFQLDGTRVGGTFKLLTKEHAALDLVGTSQSDTLQGMDPDLYSIFGRKTFTVDGYEEYQAHHQYQNRDGTYSVPVRRLWLVMHPDGGGDKTFALSMVIEQPNMSG